MKNRIWQSFEKLLMDKNKTFSDIRVGQICESAAIHRSSFYRHFEDKYQLLEYGLKTLWRDYFKIEKMVRVYQPFQTADAFYTKSKGKKIINKHLGDDNFVEAVNKFFYKEMEQVVLDILPENTDLPRELVARHAVSSIQVVEEWQRQEFLNLSTEELDRYYKKLVMKSLKID